MLVPASFISLPSVTCLLTPFAETAWKSNDDTETDFIEIGCEYYEMTQDWIKIIIFEHGDKLSGSEKLSISCLTDSYSLVMSFFFFSQKCNAVSLTCV